jgi:hypothetical protein
MFRQTEFPFLPKDFIETAEGLIFAVVTYQPQHGKVGCFLRYVKTPDGWRKVKTDEANQLLSSDYPHYLYHSSQVDANYHAVPVQNIVVHHKPEQRLQQLLIQESVDQVEQKCQALLTIFEKMGFDTTSLGLTGSMLIGQQKANSDIDFAVYGRHAFQQLRQLIAKAINDKKIEPLDLTLMRDNFARRECELSYEEFAWHEQRKYNKASIADTKFDIGMVCLPDECVDESENTYIKVGKRQIITTVTSDKYAFDFPAIYLLDHCELSEVHCFTPTYCGQARCGEVIEIAGMVEQNAQTGQLRLIVGSTREARGEYIKVINR